MDFSHLLHNFLAPPVPFFFIGLLAIMAKSDLEIPSQISKFISLYLLMAIGFKGGVELHHSGISSQVIIVLLVSIGMALLVPIYSFYILRRKLDIANAAALAASFGSVSAVTFITASNILNSSGIPYGGEMVAAMALMESPSIIVGVLMYRRLKAKAELTTAGGGSAHHVSMGELFREAFLNGSIVVLLGSLIIGLISNDKGMEIMQPFTGGIFKGMLSFFLLDMGVVAGKRIGAIKEAGWFLVGFGILMPLLNAGIGIGLSYLMGLDQGNSFMFTVLLASASYIAVPAAMRIAIPDANPGIYVPVALAIVFPFNIICGLPLYYWILQCIHQ
jgi:hypothetical protein